jgi:hypothetical protein
MPRKHAFDPIAPTTLPGEPTDPKIRTEDEQPEHEAHEETDEERQARESEKAFDRAITRTPPG